MKEWFEDWFDTKYYKALYRDRNEEEADQFLNRLMNNLNLAVNSKILDVGCGLGRHSLALNELGFDVTGIDLSFIKIKDNQKNENEKLHFYRHDMRHLFRINYFDCVFNFFTSFGYFDTLQEEKNAASCMAANLKWNGVLVMDYFNAEYIRNNLVPSEEIIIADYRYLIERKIENHRISKKITVFEESQCTVFNEKVRLYSPEEMAQLFAPYQLKLNKVYGSYVLEDYDLHMSDRMIMVFQKSNK